MDRESLRPLVDAQLGESRLTVLSEETINAELDDALTGITDDAQVDDAYAKRIADRLKRMNGNVAKEAGAQIREYKSRLNAGGGGKPGDAGDGGQAGKSGSSVEGGGSGRSDEIAELKAQISALQTSLSAKAAEEAASAVLAEVREKFAATFKEGGITAREYFVNQVFGKFKLPTLAEGENYDIDALAKDAEERYFKELKSAGIKYEKPHKGGNGGGSDGPDKAALAKREEFKARMRSKGKLPEVKD